jgi:hypothetical protein
VVAPPRVYDLGRHKKQGQPQHAKYKLALLLLPILSIPNPFQMDTLKLGVDLR